MGPSQQTPAMLSTKRTLTVMMGSDAMQSQLLALPTSAYVLWPLHRVLVIHKVYWIAFLYQRKLVEFRFRSSLQPGMSLLLSLDMFERRLGNTDLLLAKVKEVCTLPMEEAITRFLVPGRGSRLQPVKDVQSMGQNQCGVHTVEKPLLAPEFVFLVPGNLGEMHLFSVRKSNPQFCLREDVGKLVTLTDKSGQTVKYEMLNIASHHWRRCVSRPTACGNVEGAALHPIGEHGVFAVQYLHYQPQMRGTRMVAILHSVTGQQQYNPRALVQSQGKSNLCLELSCIVIA